MIEKDRGIIMVREGEKVILSYRRIAMCTAKWKFDLLKAGHEPQIQGQK